MEWKFTTSFNRSDNGGDMRCHVNWPELLYTSGLQSTSLENVQVRCKQAVIYSRTFIIETC